MTSPFDLTDKTAIITGASRGIGRAIAETYANLGARVVIASRKQAACDEVANSINARLPGKALSVAANISSHVDLENLVAIARARFGHIDILVCNAASNPHFGPLSSITDDQFETTFRNNVLSTHWLIRMLAPAMLERRDGSIILVSSIGGLRGSPVIGAYNITKAADLQLARNLAVEYGPSNVRVNCIAPGLIKTDFARALWEDPARLEGALQGTPLRRIGEPEDVAGVAAFLASSAARYVTGQTIVVDGGATVTVPGL